MSTETEPTTEALRFFVPGLPQPQGSKTRTKFGSMREDNPKTGTWRTDVAAVAQRHAPVTPLTEAVQVSVVFVFPRPRSHYGTGRNAGTLRPGAPWAHAQKPDADKLARAVLDALTAAGVLQDDALVCHLEVGKAWGTPAGAHVSVAPVVAMTMAAGDLP